MALTVLAIYNIKDGKYCQYLLTTNYFDWRGKLGGE